ncbi:nucleotidyltransferase family protein [Winogradskyella eckloniae]|uniref:nucleotidyltransferase family protein n=1 Tax=Winogradskyella eckloniae TaxID=1089306 RepID=UPI00156756EC|nr:nucleotidyltransferase family protein [Winogradskyella eckloniae]NRD21348.1 nucleotidyltransferase family protein [Winogradskyella eckloniae]
MSKYAETFHTIADILSFETPASTLETTFSDPSFNWDAIVVEGSKYLVLPAIYCRLKSRRLLHLLPEELVLYLDEISSINRNRNRSILKQVHAISTLLNAHHINHVFLKGTALLVSGKYEDIAERMVGDIDILVSNEQLQDAFHLLKSNGYNKTFGYAYEKSDFRHLDRLISEQELAAIEIHSNLLIKNKRHLIDIPLVLQSKIECNGIAIPNFKTLSLHQILSWQLNDKGHYYNFPNFKVLYDVILTHSHKNNALITTLFKIKEGQSFIAIAQHYFEEFLYIETNKYMKIIQFSHKCTMNFRPLRVIQNVFKYAFDFVLSRIYLMATNKYYTKHVFHKIFSKTTRKKTPV